MKLPPYNNYYNETILYQKPLTINIKVPMYNDNDLYKQELSLAIKIVLLIYIICAIYIIK